MGRRYTTYEIEKKLQSNNIELLSEYVNNSEKLKCKCFCGNIFYKSLKIMNKSGLYMCNDCVTKRVANSHIYPYEYLKLKIEKIGCEIITKKEEYVGVSHKIKMRCSNGHIYEQIPYDLITKGHECKTCATKKVMDKLRLSHDDVKNVVEDSGFILLSNEYVNTNTPIKVKCKVCGAIFEPTISNLRSGSGCPVCYENTRGEHSIVPYKERLEYVRSFGFDILTPEHEYVNGEHKIKILCDEGHIYESDMHSFKSGNRCPICKKSKGEVKVSSILDKYNIENIQQYKFEDCKFKKELPFDFYLPNHDCCIEFDGKQHYEIGGFGGDLWDFVDIKIRDTIKNIYCKNKNIKLIRIPYWEYKNIEYIINKELIS